MTSAHAHPYTLWEGREGNQMSARRREEYVIVSWPEIVRCICTTRIFLGGKSRKTWRGRCRCVQKLVYYCSQLVHSIRIL